MISQTEFLGSLRTAVDENVLKIRKLNEEIGAQIASVCTRKFPGKKREQQFATLFSTVEGDTGVERQTRRGTAQGETSEGKLANDRVERLKKGEGKTDFSLAIYFWIHSQESLWEIAEKLDDVFLGSPFVNWLSNRDNRGPKKSGLEAVDTKSISDSNSSLPTDIEDAFSKISSISNGAGSRDFKALILIELYKLFENNTDEVRFFYSLDYTKETRSFKFSEDEFPFSDEERFLDGLLRKLSCVGRIFRLGVIGKADLDWVIFITKVVFQNLEVQKYFSWLLRMDQIPDHSEFKEAILFYEAVIGDDKTLAFLKGVYEI